MNEDVEAFADLARAYCHWVESSTHDLAAARRWLLELLLRASCLASVSDKSEDEPEFPRQGHEGWKKTCERLADLPLQYYRLIYAPCELNTEEAVVGDLHDDLADIYGDLWHGLQAWNAGNKRTRQSIGVSFTGCIGAIMRRQPFLRWMIIIGMSRWRNEAYIVPPFQGLRFGRN